MTKSGPLLDFSLFSAGALSEDTADSAAKNTAVLHMAMVDQNYIAFVNESRGDL